MKTLGDVKKVAGITDKLLKLGVPEGICEEVHRWNKREEERILKASAVEPLIKEG